jgi:subtilisin family serine protease
VVGIRQAVPVMDTTQDIDAYKDPARLLAAIAKQPRYEYSDADMIDALTIVHTLKLPVLNMSWGSQLFYSEKVHGDNEVVVQSPAVVEAMGRVLTDGVTLGVAAAGSGQYGVGQSARGAVTERGEANAAQFPCALRALGKYHVKVLTIGLHPFHSGVNWSSASLLCVTGTYTDRPELIPHAGSGDAVVDLAAPGVTTVATRPLPGERIDSPTATYRLAYGTSFAAAMVSGAAALLRELAPKAKAPIIAQALRAGARPDLQLARTVRYGWLDVACSALWLAKRAETHKDWGVRVHAVALELPETAHCFKPSTAIYQSTWTLPKSHFAEGSRTSGTDGFSRGDFSRGLVATRLVQEAFADKDDIAKARGIQNVVLGPESSWNPDQTAFFAIQPGPLLEHPRAPTRQFVYNFQGYNVGCPAGARLTGFSLKWKDLLHPQGYIWFSPKAAINGQIFMVALIKPWYEFLLPREMRIEVTARCIRPPAGSEP